MTQIESLVSGAEELFNDYVIERIMDKSEFFRSGVVVPVAALVPTKGQFTHFPYWNGLDGESEVLTDNSSLTVNSLTTGDQVAAILARGKAFGVNDLTSMIAGDDPLKALANQIGDYWVRQYDRVLINTLAGAATGVDETGDIILDSSASAIDAAKAYDAMQLLGEYSDEIETVVMHSAVRNKLSKDNLIDTEFASDSKPVDTYVGRRVIIDDRLADNAGVYNTYFCKSGAVGFADGTPSELAVEFDRNILSGNNQMATRRRFVMHPMGASFTGTAVANTLGYTNDELASASNWASAFTDKSKFGIRVLKHTL